MKEYYHAWNCVFMGLDRPFEKLVKYNSELKPAWEKLTEKDLRNLRFHEDYIKNFKFFKKTGEPFKEFENFKNENIKVITIRDINYPPQLLELNKDFSPKILYVNGNIPNLKRHFIGIVGTRDMTDYGQTVTKRLVQVFNPDDFVVVSGLARGIDTSAHKAAIENNVPTVAVLGFGLKQLPYYQYEIAQKIIRDGAIISEYPPNIKAQKYHFPLRNRIIAGLSKAVVVVEGAVTSGALITAKHAGEQGRDVYAFPGRITDKSSEGPNKLLLEGALPINNYEDIYTYLRLTKEKNTLNLNKFSLEQKIIINHLKSGNLTQNELMHKILMPAAKLSASLTELELENVIEKNRSGKYFLKLQY
jgi:DNA processing protein